MNRIIPNQDHPDFLLKSTQGVALSSIVILVPFCLYNIYLQRPVITILIGSGIALSLFNAWFCYHGEYNKKINLFGVFPVITTGILVAIYRLGPTGTYWSFLGNLAFYFILPEREGRNVNIIFLFLVIPVAFIFLPLPFSVRFSVVLVGTNTYACFAMREIYKQHRQITRAALRDPLTDLYNRAILSKTLQYAIDLHNRSQTPMALIMFDIDHFKNINDLYGHDAGDVVLQEIGSVLKNTFRGSDLCFRIGGEEFLILLYNTSAGGSAVVAEKLRKQIASLSIKRIDRPVTISLGVSFLQDGMNGEEWLKRCDLKMYEAKTTGRNCVKVWKLNHIQNKSAMVS